jgi:cell division initiation protein
VTLTPQDIQTKEFREAFRGYNQDDVDAFLDEVAESQMRLLHELQRVRIQAASKEQEAERVRETSVEQVGAIVEHARDQAKDAVKEDVRRTLVAAQTAAEQALQEARAKASTIVADAERRARDLDQRTAERARALDPMMATTIEDLQASIDDLRRKEAEIRDRIRGMLEEQMKLIDQFEAQAHHAATVEKIAEALGDAAKPPEPDPQRFYAEPGESSEPFQASASAAPSPGQASAPPAGRASSGL